MRYLTLISGLAIGQAASGVGVLAILSFYFSWLLQIPPIEANIFFAVGSILLVFCGARITASIIRRFHLTSIGTTSRLIVTASWTTLALGMAIVLWSGAYLRFPLASTVPSFGFYLSTLTAGNVLIKFGQAAARSSVGLDANALLRQDTRPPVLYLRSFSRETIRASLLHLIRQIANYRSFMSAISQTGIKSLFQKKSNRDDDALFDTIDRSLKGMVRQSVRGGLPRIASRFSGQFILSMGNRNNEQMLFARMMNKIGPYIAVMSPRQMGNQGDVGAAKMAVEDDKWRDVISSLMSKAAAVVIEVDGSAGLMWEIGEAVSSVAPRKILVIVPAQNEAYLKAIESVGNAFPKGLPRASDVSSRLVMFLDDWTPVPLTWPTDAQEVMEEVLGGERDGNDVERLGIALIKPFIERNGVRLANN